jgi:ankyrin repeat protein
MSICGFDRWFSHITELDEQRPEITSDYLRLKLDDNKTTRHISDTIELFAQHGTFQDVDALLSHYDETIFINGSTVPETLMVAICEEGRQDLLEHMVSSGFTPCCICLIRAVSKSNNSMVDYLLSINCKIYSFILRYVDDLTIATKLILHGAEVNPKQLFCNSPLHVAIVKNSIDIALLLISMNAEVNETIVNLALKNGNPQLIEAIQAHI